MTSTIQDRVSVIIPTYNRCQEVCLAIESVLSQTYHSIEVIVVDDGSTDKTRAAVSKYGAPVRYLFQENAGVSAARNTGFSVATGEFVALLDSDDRWLPWKLDAQVRVLRRLPSVGMVWTDMAAVDAEGHRVADRYLREMYRAYDHVDLDQVLERAGQMQEMWPSCPAAIGKALVRHGDLFSEMLLGNLVHTSTVVLRRERLRQVGGFDTTLRTSGEDYEFHLHTCFHGPVAFIDWPSIEYRTGAFDQLTAPQYMIHVARNNYTTLNRWLVRGGERVRLDPGTLRKRLGAATAWVGAEELERGNFGLARVMFWKSIRLEPRAVWVWRMLLPALLPPALFSVARRAWHGLKALVAGSPTGS